MSINNHSLKVKPPRRGLLRFTSRLAVLLGVVFSFLVIVVGFWFNFTWEIPIGEVRVVSERTKNILSETQGRIRIICFMDRRDPITRPTARLLRGLASASRNVAGAEIDIDYVDPRWDMTRAAQLVARGVREKSLEFEYQRRRLVVALNDASINDRRRGFRAEQLCASAISRLVLPHRQLKICYLQGHGEVDFDDYDQFRGFSDIAHDLKRYGFLLEKLSLAGLREVPAECGVLVIAGARREMPEQEIRLVEQYLDRGGCLLYLATSGARSGCEPLLGKWGIAITAHVAVSDRTLTGNDIVISDFAEHPITRNLRGSSIVMGLATCLNVRKTSEAEDSLDLKHSMMIAQSDEQGWGEIYPEIFPRRYDPSLDLPGPVCVAAVAERGVAVSRDVAYKPTRLCVFGDVDFVMNRALTGRANANRDLFINAIGWLAGVDVGSASSVGGDATLATGFDRQRWIAAMFWSALAVPVFTLLVFRLFAVAQGGRK